MDDLHIIESRIKNLKKTKQMTYTMRLVASLKVHQLEHKVADMSLFLKHLRDFSQNVMATVEPTSDLAQFLRMDATSLLRRNINTKYNPYKKVVKPDLFDLTGGYDAKRQQGEEIDELIVILGGQHGLAGGFQATLRETLSRDTREHSEESQRYRLLTAGEKALGIAEAVQVPIIGHVHTVEDAWQSTVDIWYKICEICGSNQVHKITILSNRFYSVSRQEAEFTAILPLDAVHGSARKHAYLVASARDKSKDSNRTVRKVSNIRVIPEISMEPSLDLWLGELLLRVAYVSLLQLVNESLAAEYIQRLHAMSSATSNAEDLLHDLELSFQRSRQSKITQDILDILGGSDLDE